MMPPLILREKWGARAILRLGREGKDRVAFGRKHRPSGNKIGGVPVYTDAGVDRSRVSLVIGESSTWTLRLEKAAIDPALRRVREQEYEEIQRVDAEIARLRAERQELIERAWQKGHVVTVKELREAAEARDGAAALEH